MNQTIKPSRPTLHLKSNNGSSIGNSGEFEAYGFKIKVAKDGRRIWPEEFKRYIVEKLASGELITKNVAKTCDIERTMVYQWKRKIRNKDRIARVSENDNELAPFLIGHYA